MTVPGLYERTNQGRGGERGGQKIARTFATTFKESFSLHLPFGFRPQSDAMTPTYHSHEAQIKRIHHIYVKSFKNCSAFV